MRLRKFFRFSLRTFLVMTTVVAIWLAFHLRGVQKQKAAVAGVLEFGGWAYYDFQFRDGRILPGNTDLNAEPLAPAWLVDALGVDWFHDVVAVNLYYGQRDGAPVVNSRYSDEGMKYLADLPELRIVFLDYRQATAESMVYLSGARKLEYLQMADVLIGDEGAAHLRNLKNLRWLSIHNAGLTDRSIHTIASLPKLERLSLGHNELTNKALELLSGHTGIVRLNLGGPSCRINDEGLPHLARMSQLQELDLEGSRISDAGLKHLEKLPRLRKLSVGDTNITWRGADTWKKTLDYPIQFNGHALKR